MQVGALEAFSQALNSAPAASRKLRWRLPIWALGLNSGPKLQPRLPSCSLIRPFTSVYKPPLPYGSSSRNPREAPQIKKDDPGDFVRGPMKREPKAWEAVLDQYLPQSLRTSAQKSNDGPGNPAPLSIEKVPLILDRARQAARVDLLCYIGVYQERWEALNWLVNAMLGKCPRYIDTKGFSEVLPTSLWDTKGPSLDEITRLPIRVVTPIRSSFQLDALVGPGSIGTRARFVAESRGYLGAIWQSLGSMLLEIEDRSRGNPNRPLILTHVLQILARMHHKDVLPDSIYNYDLAENNSVLRRPPLLHLLSMKILEILSDMSWAATQAHEMKKARPEIQESAKLKVQSHLLRVGAEVWLELVLWACVEGGWISEAAWLVNEVQRRRENSERRWSVISWDEVSSRKVQSLSWIDSLKMEINLGRTNKAKEIALANRQTSNVNSDMGTRTISREVVLAIVDGLANIVSDSHLLGNTVTKMQGYLLSCQGLLEQGKLAMDSGYINTLILRTMESSVINARRQPGYLQLLMALRPTEVRPSAMSPPLSSLIRSSLLDTSAPTLGLLHRLLDCYARQGNLRGSLVTLKSMQEAIDDNRDIHIQSFADKLGRHPRQASESGEFEPEPQQNFLMLYPEIPSYAVEAFLDLLVESKAFDLGQWILFNDEIDGGILSPSAFSDTSIQPALLRFATATANDDLLLKVLEHVEAPLPEPILHALLHCQASVNRWGGVEGILKHFRDTKGMAWTPGDAMAIAAAIPTLEWKDETRSIGHSLHAKGILQALVQGEFNTPQNRAQIPDLHEARTANQLGRIFQSVSGTLSTIELGRKGYYGRTSYSVMIPSDAFNLLLASVIQNHGSLAGIKLWERWCLEPVHWEVLDQQIVVSAGGDGTEKVVKPTVSMLRLILQPATESLQNTNSNLAKLAPKKSNDSSLDQDDNPAENILASKGVRESLTVSGDSLSVFDWCMDMYKKFGFSDREILREIPPSFGRIIEI